MQRGPKLALMVFATLLAGKRAAADARALQSIDSDMASLGVQLKALTDRDLAEQTAKGLRSFAAQLSDAEVLFLLGDFDRASLLLYQLVQWPNSAAQPGYDKALNYLAESFFQGRNDRMAQLYFKQILQRPASTYRTDAARRLLEIADRQQRWEGVSAEMSAVRQNGVLPAEVAYSYAKSLLLRGRVEDANQAAAQVPKEHPLALKADYLRAVVQLQAGELDLAKSTFAVLRAGTSHGRYEDDDVVRDLSTLDSGRIMMDQGQYTDALAAYEQVDPHSSRFEDSLFELTWIFVRTANSASDADVRSAAYQKALNKLDILALEPSNLRLVPEAQLLAANILVQLGRYDAAQNAFSAVIAAYSPMRDQIAALETQQTDLTAAFLPGSTQEVILPPLAMDLAHDEGGLARAMAIAVDLEQSRASLTEAEALADKLALTLQEQAAAHFSLTMKDVQMRTLAAENSAQALSERLLAAQRQVVQPSLSPEQASQLQAIEADRATFAVQYHALPQRREDYEGRTRGVQEALHSLMRNDYSVKFAIEAEERQMHALLSWHSQHPEVLGAADVAQFQTRMAAERAAIAEMKQARNEIGDAIEAQRSLIGVAGLDGDAEASLRARYVASLEQEHELLTAAEGNVSGEGKATLEALSTQRQLLASYHITLAQFKTAMRSMMRGEMERNQADVTAARGILQTHRDELDSIAADSQPAVQHVMASAVRGVRNKINDYVLRGDVGMVDIAWALKDEQEHVYNRENSQKSAETKNSENEFKDVMTKD